MKDLAQIILVAWNDFHRDKLLIIFLFLLFTSCFLSPASAFAQSSVFFEISSDPVDSFGSMADDTVENLTYNYIDACRFQMGGVEGNLTDIRLKLGNSVSGNVKFAIYSDTLAGGFYWARTKLWADDVGQTIVAGWNSVATLSVTLNANTYYWLCCKMSVTNPVRWVMGEDFQHRWKSHPYATSWPTVIDPASWGGNNAKVHRYLGIYSYGGAAEGKEKPGGLIQDEDGEGITGGGVGK